MTSPSMSRETVVNGRYLTGLLFNWISSVFVAATTLAFSSIRFTLSAELFVSRLDLDLFRAFDDAARLLLVMYLVGCTISWFVRMAMAASPCYHHQEEEWMGRDGEKLFKN